MDISDQPPQRSERELTEFQIRNIRILTSLLANDAVSDEIVDWLRESELEHLGLLNKYRLLESRATIDDKTGLFKYSPNYLVDIIKTAGRIYHGNPDKHYYISMVRFDIDDFSRFNNRYGHAVGDMALVTLANVLRSNSRDIDYVIRFGGEEFDAILPTTPAVGAVCYLDKIFDRVRQIRINWQGEDLRLTTSAGIASMVWNFDEGKRVGEAEICNAYAVLQRQADDALYAAKAGGKDRFVLYDQKDEAQYRRFREHYEKSK